MLDIIFYFENKNTILSQDTLYLMIQLIHLVKLNK